MKSINKRLKIIIETLMDSNLVWQVLCFVGFSFLVWGSLSIGIEHFLLSSSGKLIRLHGLAIMVVTILTILSLGYFLFRTSTIWLLCYVSIPVGLLVSLLELMNASAIAETANLEITLINILLPFFIAGLLCALAFFLMRENEDSNDKKYVSQVKIWSFLIISSALPFSFFLVGHSNLNLVNLFNGNGLIILNGCILMSLVRQRRNTGKSIIDFGLVEYSSVFLDGGKVAAYMGAGVIALWYISINRAENMEWLIGGILALGSQAIFFGTLGYLCGILLASITGNADSQKYLRLDAWHLAEAFGFLILCLFSAQSVFDMNL